MAWMLEGAGLSAAGITGALRVKVLLGVWTATVRVWLRDEDPDLGRTMAALDRNLRRADGLGSLFGGGRSGTESEV